MDTITALNRTLTPKRANLRLPFLTPSAKQFKKQIGHPAGRKEIPRTHKHIMMDKHQPWVQSCTLSLASPKDGNSMNQAQIEDQDESHRSMSSSFSNLSDSSMFEEMAPQINPVQVHIENEIQVDRYFELATPCSKSSLEVSYIFSTAEPLVRKIQGELGPHKNGLDIPGIIRKIALADYRVTEEEFASFFVHKESDFYDYFYMREVEKLISEVIQKRNDKTLIKKVN